MFDIVMNAHECTTTSEKIIFHYNNRKAVYSKVTNGDKYNGIAYKIPIIKDTTLGVSPDGVYIVNTDNKVIYRA